MEGEDDGDYLNEDFEESRESFSQCLINEEGKVKRLVYCKEFHFAPRLRKFTIRALLR